MILNVKSLIEKLKLEKLNSTILQPPLFMSIRVVLRKLGQASPCQVEYVMQIQAPLNSPRRAYWETQGLQPATPIFSAKF